MKLRAPLAKAQEVNVEALMRLVDPVQQQDIPDPDDMMQMASIAHGLRMATRATRQLLP